MAITEVGGGTQRASTDSGATSLAYPGNVTSGSLLVVSGTTYLSTGNPSITGVTDTLGTSYTVVNGTVVANLEKRPFIAWGFAPSSGANTPAVTVTGVMVLLAIDEFAGVASADVNGGSSTGTSTTPSDAITPTATNALLVGALAADATSTVTVGSGFTQIGETEGNPAAGVEFQIVTTAQAYTVDWTLGTSRDWSAQTYSFTPSNGGVGGPVKTGRRSALFGVGR